MNKGEMFGSTGTNNKTSLSSRSDATGSSPELRLMMVGSSGASQFQLANAILGREEFPKDAVSISGSRKILGELSGRRVALISAPNLYDKDISGVKRKTELRRSKCLSVPGPHAFLVAFDMEKISPNDIRTPQLMMRRFGRHCLRHSVVLLAYDENLDSTASAAIVQNADWPLKRLIEDFGGRFYIFSKNWRDRSYEREMLRKVEWTVASLGGACFSSRTFRKAERSVKKEEKRLMKKAVADDQKARSEPESLSHEWYCHKDGAEIRAKAEVDNGWLRTSLARGVGSGAVAGAVTGTLAGSIEGPGGMLLYGLIGGALGASAGASAQVATKRMEDRVAPPARLNFNSIFINRFFATPRP
ncbi:GTPase IMAP family member 7 isoform X1 [Syngnathus scovelli]|uniref:GTPase IMAP family member 7 isoform X1 n=1 Tax=Syngnathus scovelli TaxID=161590 RepID=UPI0021101037|nr:GTPase IMAP family member 7 isoform X1 [Syngnathus scovelli]